MSAVNILRKEVFLVNLHKNFPAVAGTAVVTAAIANSSSTQGEFADIFDVVKSQSEVAAASAKAGADIAVDFLKENAPEALNNIDVGTVPSVLTSIQGAVPSLVGEAIAKGDHISNLVIEKGPGIASDLGEYAVDAANTFRSIMPDIMRVAGDAAKLIGDVMAPAGAVIAHVAGQVANAISSDVAIASLTASLEGIGMVALTFPFLLPITQALKGLAQAIKFAMFNKEKALILADRCKETADCIKSLVPKLQKLLEEAESLLKPVEKAINECTDFVEKFTKRGFLLKLMQYSKDDFKLSVLDKKVTDALQNLSLRVSGEQYDLQVKTAEKLDDLFLMMKEKTGNNLDPSSISPTAMLEIAKKSGCVTSEEMTFELQGLGYKLDEIKSSIESVEKTVNAIDSKIDEVQVHLLTQKEAAEQHKKELMDALRKQEEDRNAHHEKASEMQAEMLRKQAEAQTLQMQTMMKLERLAGKAVPVVYSDANQSELVSNKAAAVVPDLRAANVVVIHPRGIGSPIEKREGENGTNGTHGTNHPPAMRGSDGK